MLHAPGAQQTASDEKETFSSEPCWSLLRMLYARMWYLVETVADQMKSQISDKPEGREVRLIKTAARLVK